MCPGLWEELACSRQPAGRLWLSGLLFLWRMEPGWVGLLWGLLLEAPLHAEGARLHDSLNKTQKSSMFRLKEPKKRNILEEERDMCALLRWIVADRVQSIFAALKDTVRITVSSIQVHFIPHLHDDTL